jgi:hypothetical protein
VQQRFDLEACCSVRQLCTKSNTRATRNEEVCSRVPCLIHSVILVTIYQYLYPSCKSSPQGIDLHFQPTMKSFAIGTLFLAIRSATAQVCGQSGYDNSGHDSASLPAYAVDTQATTPQLCSALCKSDSNCQSFAIGKETCLLYAVPTENNITPDDKRKDFSSTRSPYYFYDVNCEITSSSPPLSHSSPICGVKGYDRGNPGSGWIESGSTPEQAAAGCRATPNCTAFALINNFVSHRGTGSFRYSSLVDNFDANSIDDPDIGSSFYFYELSCPGV